MRPKDPQVTMRKEKREAFLSADLVSPFGFSTPRSLRRLRGPHSPESLWHSTFHHAYL